MTVFAALCSEIDEHRVKAQTKFYLPLLMYGEGGKINVEGWCADKCFFESKF